MRQKKEPGDMNVSNAPTKVLGEEQCMMRLFTVSVIQGRACTVSV